MRPDVRAKTSPADLRRAEIPAQVPMTKLTERV